METVVVGSRIGSPEDYEDLKEITGEETGILDDANPLERSGFILEKGADLLISGMKERSIAYKMGISFFDHNYERKEALAGSAGGLKACIPLIHGSQGCSTYIRRYV
jgi:nitrogenase molybdenum-cofactor synthesis protein NifE